MSKPKTPLPNANSRRRVALYARVSTQEQTKGQYPSCESQIEELETYCKAKGWDAAEAIKDEGKSAGSLKRPGLTRLRWLVENDQISGVLCTWYDRLTRSREFYVLDKEFRTHNVDFITLHDPADRNTASGRFMEMMLVGAKAYEREQTGEKVRTKMRMRAEKGLWNGGLVPFGFQRDPQTQILCPDPEKAKIVAQMFRVYVDNRSDFTVRDWLKARQIPAPGGKPIWSVGTIRDLLTNRRYVAEIEINKDNKNLPDLPEFEAYRIVRAPHEPIVPLDLFEQAQAIRSEKAQQYPNNPGKTRSFSQSRCERVYLLQGLLACAVCGHPMSPHYVFHKAGKNRRKDSYISHYVCTLHRKYGTDCDHSNRVLARTAEAWMLERIRDLVDSQNTIELAIESARRHYEADLQPHREELAVTRAGLQETQKEIDTLIATITSGTATGALVGFLNQRANELKQQQENLRAEQRRLMASSAPLDDYFDAATYRKVLTDFSILSNKAEPAELQRLLRFFVRQIRWGSDGTHRVRFFGLPRTTEAKKTTETKTNQFQPEQGQNWFDTDVRSGCPNHRSSEPLILQVHRTLTNIIPDTATIFRLVSSRLATGNVAGLGPEVL